MESPSELVSLVSREFIPYLHLLRLTGEKYYFRKESTGLRDSSGAKRFWHPKIEHRMLRDYHAASDEILYAVFPSSAKIDSLEAEDLLYIGCSVGGGSRFWRGKIDANTKFPKLKSCFHHEPMRRGREGNSLERYLEEVGPVTVHTMTSVDVLSLAKEHRLDLPVGKYPAHQLERKILAEGFKRWSWNARK